MTSSEQQSNNDGYGGFHALYCEGCAQLLKASDRIEENTEEPVHRVDIIEAIGEFKEVGETVAQERGTCDDCGGQIVRRDYVYPQSEVPEMDYEPDPEQFSGRDPDEDALLAMSSDPEPEEFEEVREIAWLQEGNDAE